MPDVPDVTVQLVNSDSLSLLSWFFSPAVGGLGALLAAVIVGVVTMYATHQRAEQVDNQRKDTELSLKVQRLWDRFMWVVEFYENASEPKEIDIVNETLTSLQTTAVETADKALQQIIVSYSTAVYAMEQNASRQSP